MKFLDYSDNALPGVDGWVIFDNLQGAKLVGDYAGEWVNQNLGGKAEVALLTHQIQLTGKQRIEGSVAALQSVAPGAKVVAQHDGILSPDTFPAFQSMLQAHPNINVAICIADEGCAGIEQAFMGTHPSAERIKDMFICGFDGSGPVIKAIGTGGPIRAAGALVNAVAIGKASIETAANAIEGKTPTKINFPYVLCTVQTTALDQKLLAELHARPRSTALGRTGTPPFREPISPGGIDVLQAIRSRRSGGVPRPQRTHGSLPRLGAAQGGGLWVALILLSLYFSWTTGSFFTQSNLLVVLEQVSVLGMVAVPGAMLLVSGNLDLSVGSVAGLAAAMFGEFNKVFGWPLLLSFIGALAVGAAWGTMNGILISYLGFSPVIVTLGGYAGAAGLAQTITSDSTRSGFGPVFGQLGNGTLARIPVPGVIFVVVFLAGTYVWYEMRTGRRLIAIGANKEAANALGVATRRLPCVIYILSGTAAALGGLIITSQLDGASVQMESAWNCRY